MLFYCLEFHGHGEWYEYMFKWYKVTTFEKISRSQLKGSDGNKNGEYHYSGKGVQTYSCY